MPGRPATALGVVAACLRFCAEHPDNKLLVAGHTDTVGGDDDNLAL